MLCRKLLLFLFVFQHVYAMDMPVRTRSKQVSYQSVVPFCRSGRTVPSLQVLAAQKVHALKRRGLLTPEQLQLFSSLNNSQSSSPEEIICNDVLQRDFSHMRKDSAEEYAFDLASGRVPRSGSGGRVQQKALAIEIRDKINR